MLTIPGHLSLLSFSLSFLSIQRSNKSQVINKIQSRWSELCGEEFVSSLLHAISRLVEEQQLILSSTHGNSLSSNKPYWQHTKPPACSTCQVYFHTKGWESKSGRKGTSLFICDSICIKPLEYALLSMHQAHGLHWCLYSAFHMWESSSMLKITTEFMLWKSDL